MNECLGKQTMQRGKSRLGGEGETGPQRDRRAGTRPSGARNEGLRSQGLFYKQRLRFPDGTTLP